MDWSFVSQQALEEIAFDSVTDSVTIERCTKCGTMFYIQGHYCQMQKSSKLLFLDASSS